MSRPKLSYFEMRGRAESIRIFLHANQIEFEDHRVVSREEWADLQPTLPFGSLPMFESEQVHICESHATLRHLGRLHGAHGSDEVAAAELDVAQDAIAWSQEDLWRFNWRENYYDHLESYAQLTLEPRLRRLEGWLERGGRNASEWFGEEFSHVDCVAFVFLDEVDAFFPDLLAELAGLSELRSRVASLPGASGYLASDARPPVFGIGAMGPKVDPRVVLAPEQQLENPWSDPVDLAPILARQRRLTRSSG